MTGARWEDAFHRASAVYHNHFAMLSMTAYSYFLDTVDMIEATPRYHGRAKHIINRCREWIRKYWQRLRVKYGDKWALYYDYANQAAAGVERDVTLFYFAVKNALDKRRADESDIKAHVLVTAELLRVAVAFHRDYWQAARRLTRYNDIGDNCRYADPEPLFRLFMDFAGMVCRDEDAAVLDDDQSARTGLRVILAKCENVDYLNQAAGVAAGYNAEVVAKYG